MITWINDNETLTFFWCLPYLMVIIIVSSSRSDILSASHLTIFSLTLSIATYISGSPFPSVGASPHGLRNSASALGLFPA